jgi:iron complex outermembrane receptor protein
MSNLKFTIFFFVVFAKTTIAQTNLNGKIYDAKTGEPLTGAAVLVKGSTYGTVTNIHGEFTISLTQSLPVTLLLSYIGYNEEEVKVLENKKLDVYLAPASAFNKVTVTARRRKEEVQETPIPITVLSAKEIDNTASFNVNRIKELIPSIQLYSSNPRNTTLNIRGLGSTFGLTNDGIEPGVGFYVDGVYYARPAATTLDFVDVKQIEVLRGPQGTLFGKNTTAGTFNITTKKPTFNTTATFEQTFGNYGFIQTKGSLSFPVIKDKLAARLALSGTYRDGTIYNVKIDKYTNTLNNQGLRGKLLYLPANNIAITLAGDYTRQRPDGYAQVYAGTVPTQRPAFRQFENIIADLNYTLPSRNPFDRIIDTDVPWKSNQDMGGVSLNADFQIWNGTLTSTSAWRTWKWNPSSDRDFTGLQALSRSEAPSIHNQWSQELRYAGKLSRKISGVAGIFLFYQKLDADGAQIEESGKAQWRFVETSQDSLWKTPGLLDGYGIKTYPSFINFSGAFFGQVDWKISENLTFLPGIRLNYDKKKVDFKRVTYGGLQTTDSALLALQKSVYSNQSFIANVNDWNVSGQATLHFKISKKIRTFGTYALGFKPVGLNLGGLPTEGGKPLTNLAVVKPERVNHFEVGVKSEPFTNAIINITAYYTRIKNYQANVRSSQLGVNRGYLANAELVRVSGVELEAAYNHPKYFKVNGSVSYTDGCYLSFKNAPVPLEETGGANFKDISGETLPGISKWAMAGGFEAFKKTNFEKQKGEFFVGVDVYYRSSFSSNPTPSKYLNVQGYALLNARIGFRAYQGISLFIWSRNIVNVNYFEQLLPASGDAGQYAAVLGDPRTYGLTLRYDFF